MTNRDYRSGVSSWRLFQGVNAAGGPGVCLTAPASATAAGAAFRWSAAAAAACLDLLGTSAAAELEGFPPPRPREKPLSLPQSRKTLQSFPAVAAGTPENEGASRGRRRRPQQQHTYRPDLSLKQGWKPHLAEEGDSKGPHLETCTLPGRPAGVWAPRKYLVQAEPL